MTWEQNEVPMKSHGTISNTDCAQELYLIQAGENQKIRILDSDYSSVDIADHIANLHVLSTTEK
jgi:hypothetical protein